MFGRTPIVDIHPRVDCGRRPIKAVVGEAVEVRATVFLEVPEQAGANIVLRGPQGRPRPWNPMRCVNPGLDLWVGEFTPTSAGLWTYAVEGWHDPVASWRRVATAKVPAGVDVDLVLEEGAGLLLRAGRGVPGETGRQVLTRAATAMRDPELSPTDRLAASETADVEAVLSEHPLREAVTETSPIPVRVDRERALVGSWYEFFPRSEGAVVDPSGRTPPRSGTLRTAMERLPAIAAMGFDVVYLPPIHPIGHTNRKGPNNATVAGPHDPGVPWAIGSSEGGHDSVHPDLGTTEDWDAFVARASELGLEVALDFALTCSPDHPWVEQHPQWFRRQSDGTIAFAENPPKKYQDIYPLSFDTDPDGILKECLRVLRHWMDHGVRIFRCDNPHTKPMSFWEKLIAEINRTDPDVIFLSEAYSRPALKYALAEAGFHQSYTYFTWRNTKDEVEGYLRELVDNAHRLRPNLWVNTPDVLHEYLQHGGQPAFKIRATLAATLGPTWGMYTGFELCENEPRQPGSEEYRDSEKYQYRPRDWSGAERAGTTIAPYITTLNELRRAHPALRRLRDLHFHRADNDAVTAYSKRVVTDQGEDVVLVVVNLDPGGAREATVSLDMPRLGLGWHDSFTVRDELTGATYRWGEHNYVRLDPAIEPAHIFTVRRSLT